MSFGPLSKPFSRFAHAAVAASLGWTLLATGCGSSTTGDAGTKTKGNVVIKDENNYTATSIITAPHVQTKPGADLKVCWDAVDKDLLCHDVNPASDDINYVRFLNFANLSASDVEKKLQQGDIPSTSVERFFDYFPEGSAGKTCTQLSAMKASNDAALDPAKDYVVASDATYMLLFAHQVSGGGSQARSIAFLDPTEGSSVTEVNAIPGCGILDFKADITTRAKVDIPADGPWVADWSLLTKDGLSQPVIFPNIDQLLLAYYDMPVSELQEKFLDIQIIAKQMYEIALPEGKKYIDLKTATSSTDGAFAGFTQREGTWAIALMCTTCQVPAPIALVILNIT